ncbi:glucose-repressible alcohol dehydrogenase transcriptional effector [Ephemerocybe angulata]|uniref:CCR4-Not complex 3'-5'-exoribonuclease subunit Ccr4 n=1 Tax=Ephemerocybe angulata TaxID=980116 RepID=A0A8H6IE15_9AGAR|nr:glucose-repressible alcohol dehydrogenase transcriptional effector [Tulosesus angulatus]
MHHHQNSLSHYPSPPNGHAQQQHQQPHLMAQGSPAGQIISPHWQQQLLKCDMIRQSRSPHHRARASAMASRTVPKSAIPITNPNSKITITSPKPEAANGRPKTFEDLSTTAASTSSEPATKSPGTPTHPSSTTAPIAEFQRPTATKPPENTWGSLDMGGVNIKNLPASSGLFSFTFLINLYLNHNALTAVPAEISKLRHLELLDLSGNALATLPPELGLLVQLKELYLFDNHLSTLPPELGCLHQLQTLGIEGNPMDSNLKAIIQKDGTSALVCYLRDNALNTPPPPQRQWKNLLSAAEREALTADPNAETFSILSFNILCERYATEKLYGYTPNWALAWAYRRNNITKEVLAHDTDVVCLQEVDIAQYEDYFVKTLGEHGYSGVYWPKSRAKMIQDEETRRAVDGCATFYKTSKFQLVEKQLVEFSSVAMQRTDFKKTDDMFNRVLGKDHIAVVSLLEEIHTGTRFIVANAHIHWDPAFSDVKLVQSALLVDEVEKAANNFAKYPPRPPASATSGSNNDPDAKPERPPPHYSDGTKIPVIICGDYNSVPSSGLYEYMSTGHLAPNHGDFLGHTYGKYTSEGLKHRLNLKSAYSTPGAGGGLNGDNHITNFTPGFKGEIDYMWFSAGNLGVNSVLEQLDQRYLDKCVGFPNAHFPSDHVALACEFRVKPPRDSTKSA